MAILLDGTTQWVRVGSAGASTDVYRTRPFTVAALINTDNIGSGTIRWIISQDGYSSWGFGLLDTDVLFLTRNGSQTHYSTITITESTGWWMVAAVMRDAGANTTFDYFAYRYATSTLSTSGPSSTAFDSDPGAPGSTIETRIGSDGNDLGEHWPDAVGWAGVWAGDLGDARSATAPRIWELITRGPWGMIDSDCKLFVPMLRSNLMDFSSNRYSLTNVGGASFVGGGPTELPYASAYFVAVNEGVAATTLDAGTQTVTVTAPTTALALALSLAAGNQAVTATAPTTAFALALNLAAGDQSVTVTAPTLVLAAALTLDGGTQTLTATAPVTAFSLGGVNLAAGDQAVTATAPTADLNTGLFFDAGTQTVTLTTPAATFVLGGITLAAGTQTATVTAPTSVLDPGSLALLQDAQVVTLYAPTLDLVVGSITLAAGTLTVTITAPEGVLDVGGVITSSSVLPLLLIPGDRMDRGPISGLYKSW